MFPLNVTTDKDIYYWVFPLLEMLVGDIREYLVYKILACLVGLVWELLLLHVLGKKQNTCISGDPSNPDFWCQPYFLKSIWVKLKNELITELFKLINVPKKQHVTRTNNAQNSVYT